MLRVLPLAFFTSSFSLSRPSSHPPCLLGPQDQAHLAAQTPAVPLGSCYLGNGNMARSLNAFRCHDALRLTLKVTYYPTIECHGQRILEAA